MKVSNIQVYDLFESIVASGFPMLVKFDAKNFDAGVTFLRSEYKTRNWASNKHVKRAVSLAQTPVGSGHDNFLSGVVVSFNVTASQTWWLQFGRYHFAQIVSSQSKMHRLRQMLGEEKTEGKNDMELIAECPMSFELTARVTTNYRQLRTIYQQRKNHRLEEWRTFCDFIERLPLAKDLLCPCVTDAL